MSKRILSVILLICMLVNNLPAAAFAEESTSGCSHVCDEICGFAEEVACDKDCPAGEAHAEDCAYQPGSECAHQHNGQCGVACTHAYAEGVCAICGETEPQPQPCEHSGGEATCEVLAVCELCGVGYGQLAAHVYEEGKCACGDVCEHTFAEGICTVCGMEEPETEPVCTCDSDDPVLHAPFCDLFVRSETPVCDCQVSCLAEERNRYCEVCYFNGAENCTGGEESAVPYAEPYDLWVGGEQFTSEKLTINGTSGTATYNPETSTLTLNNFSYTGEGRVTQNYNAAIYTDSINLNVELHGTNTITCQSNDENVTCYAIDVWYGLDSSAGKLTIYGTNKETDKLICTANDGITSVRSLTVEDATVQTNGAQISSAVSNVTITDSIVSADVEANGDITVENSELKIFETANVGNGFNISNSIVTGGGLSAFDYASVLTVTGSKVNVSNISSFAFVIEDNSNVDAQTILVDQALIVTDSSVHVAGGEIPELSLEGSFGILLLRSDGVVAIDNSTVEVYGANGAYLYTEDFQTFNPFAPSFVDGEEIGSADDYTVTAGETAPGQPADASEAATYENKYVKIEPVIPHTHSIDGFSGTQVWTPVSSLGEITTSGYYYLEKDVTLSENWTPVSGTVLCLNGHDITFTSGCVYLRNISEFTLTDCEPDGDVGEITGGTGYSNNNGSSYGGGVYVRGGTFTMYGGKITGNSASYGGGVWTHNSDTTKFYMYGGEIKDNTSSYGDVYLSAKPQLTLSGSPVIGSLYLASPNNPLTIGARGLKSGAEITVAISSGTTSAKVAAENDTDYSDFFKSWNDAYVISYNANREIQLAKPEKHTVKFIVDQKPNGNSFTQNVEHGNTLPKPSLADGNITMPGYTLVGWCTDQFTLEQEWDFAKDITQNLTLHAKLKLNPANIDCSDDYTGTYDEQSHQISVTASHNAYDNMSQYFTYQWYKDGKDEGNKIENATNSTYDVTDVADSGIYYCKVTASDKAFIDYPAKLALTSEAWSDPITVTISKQEVTPPTIDSKVFNGSTQTAAVPTSDLYTVKQNNGGINAGIYDVILTLTDPANYTWPNRDTADYEMQFVIEPADQAALEITGLPATAAYEDTFTLTTSGGSGDGSVSWAVTNGLATVDAATGYVTITGVGSITIHATKAGGDNYKEATATVTFTSVKAKQEKPNGLTPTQETIAGKQDGKISGVNSNMEYKLKGAESYIPIGNVTMLENLPSGTYLIRFKADENHEASEDVEITVQQGKMLTVTLPTVQTGYTLAVKDNGSNEVTFSGSIVLTYELAEGYTEGTDFAVNATYGTVTANQDGTYTISGIEQDTTVSVTGVRDITAPTAEIAITTNKWTEFLNTITFDLFFKQTQTVIIDAQDAGSGVKTIEYYLSETEMTLDAVKAITAWEGYNGRFSIDAEKQYVIYAKVTDNAENGGNTVYINSNGIVMDKTAPIFSGVTDGNEYYTTQKVTVTETNLLSLTCNGFAVESPITLEGNKDFTYEIVATDKAGNSSKITVVMNPVENLSGPLPEDTTLELDDKEEIEALKENVSSIWANNLSNITDEEEAALKAIIARCDALLQIIANVNNVNDQVKALKAPAEISPDEIDVILAYDDALEAYEKLTKRGKELVDTNELAKLEAVGKALTAYDVIKGHKSSYVKGSFKTISIVANGYYDVFGKYADGAFGKFREVRIDGEFLDPQYYTAASGSTVITLKTSYLESLETGKHYIQFVYVDGSTDGNDYFRVSVNNGSPMTGDNSHILMFTGMAVTSLLCAAMLIVFFPRKKGKYER